MIDKGEWSVDGGIKNAYLQSDDFTHDVILRVYGDFGSEQEKIEYLKDIIFRLNKNRGE